MKSSAASNQGNHPLGTTRGNAGYKRGIGTLETAQRGRAHHGRNLVLSTRPSSCKSALLRKSRSESSSNGLTASVQQILQENNRIPLTASAACLLNCIKELQNWWLHPFITTVVILSTLAARKRRFCFTSSSLFWALFGQITTNLTFKLTLY